ncbi:MAG TPA: class I SAM-dependent methyltransferase [Thermoanaerobaculia bacterium]|nr:class I SAM-dependent methyltransferase [Thermoanaerobaculia bacterium]
MTPRTEESPERELWPRLRGYGDLLRDRATGAAEEMESAKALCRLLGERYRPGARLLDVGCGSAHYLRSLRRRLDPEIDYTGLDLTLPFLARGRAVFPVVPLAAGDAFALPFRDRAFDLVLCNNLLLHLPPPPERALAELARVAAERVLVRTPVGRRNYVIREVREPEDLDEGDRDPGDDDLFAPDGAPRRFNYFNLYTEVYLTRAARRAAPGAHVRLEPDTSFGSFDNRAATTATGTHVIDRRQVAGNLLLDWCWLEVAWTS